MYIQTENGEGVVAYHVMNLTPREMNQIAEIDKKVATVLFSHREEYKGKKLYLNDDDLFAIRGILYAFARYSQQNSSSEFDIVKEKLMREFADTHPEPIGAS